LTSVGEKACAILAAAAESLGEPWQRRAEARDLVQHVIALNEHLASHMGADTKALAETLMARRGWALWCLLALGESATQAIELGESLVADRTRVLGTSIWTR
jgi:hypothetical protein